MTAKAKKKAQKKEQKNSHPTKPEEVRDREFEAAYKKLCEKHQRGLTATPSWRFSQDGNDFRLIINMVINRWPKTDNNNV